MTTSDAPRLRARTRPPTASRRRPRPLRARPRRARGRWAGAMARAPMTADEMTGADAKAQRLGVPGDPAHGAGRGTAVAAAARALAVETRALGTRGRSSSWAGPATTAATASWRPGGWPRTGRGSRSCSSPSEARPADPRRGPELGPPGPARRTSSGSTSRWPATSRMLGHGVERAAIVVDALLGTGVRGVLREPVRSAVELANRARAAGRPRPRRRLPDGRRPDLGRALRPGRAGRRHDHLPPAQDRAPHAAGRRGGGPRARGADRDPARSRPCLTRPSGRGAVAGLARGHPAGGRDPRRRPRPRDRQRGAAARARGVPGVPDDDRRPRRRDDRRTPGRHRPATPALMAAGPGARSAAGAGVPDRRPAAEEWLAIRIARTRPGQDRLRSRSLTPSPGRHATE